MPPAAMYSSPSASLRPSNPTGKTAAPGLAFSSFERYLCHLPSNRSRALVSDSLSVLLRVATDTVPRAPSPLLRLLEASPSQSSMSFFASINSPSTSITLNWSALLVTKVKSMSLNSLGTDLLQTATDSRNFDLNQVIWPICFLISASSGVSASNDDWISSADLPHTQHLDASGIVLQGRG